MQNFVIIAVIALLLMCGCVSERTVVVDKAHAELMAFWDSTESLLELFNAMPQLGYHYYNELNDINYYLDTAPPPEVSHERRWFNCFGAARYTAEYIKYKRNCDSYKMVLMLKRGFVGAVVSWHYITIIHTGNIIYMQSNNELRLLEVDEQAELFWRTQGYESFQVVEEWQK